ncbi:formate dehydrogenase subunit delta [Paracoccaceae bacterium GXU_MW_L88]
MKPDHLVTMANQIADFFAAYPETEAVDGVAGHIEKFWDPRMRAAMAAHLDAGGDGLTPLARQGAEKLLAQAK